MFLLLKVQISAIFDSSPSIGPSGIIEHGVPKEVAGAMVEQIIQEFDKKWESLTDDSVRANIQNIVEEWKGHARQVTIPLGGWLYF